VAVPQLSSAIAAKQTMNPKTVLAFYAGVLAIDIVGATTAIAVLAWSGKSIWLIPWILAVAVVIFIALVIAVFVLNIMAPAKLMLTQVTGREYMQIQQSTLGDSLTGEHPVQVQAFPGLASELPTARSTQGKDQE
jgi:hypothetical protein